MEYTTDGKEIKRAFITCNCGLTAGCSKCRQDFIGMLSDEEAKVAKEKLKDWKGRFNQSFCNHIWEECGEVKHCVNCGKHSK